MKKEIEFERQLKILANRRRLAILTLLKIKREGNVGDISAAIRLSFTSTSKHLTMLERAGFIEKEQRSLNVFYRLASKEHALLGHILTSL
ncbi:winged helix-turn-helix transcriptional regulator [Acetobacteraceae bacterium]|nr:winged helix-turn-helix transcriptional regulator [Candidatus Parcubacteria bacterium]